MPAHRIIPAFCLLILAAVQFDVAAADDASQIRQIRSGWELFNEKQCIRCHAVWGEGESIGPDLGRTTTEFLSAGQLAGVMWNHAPDMWSRMASKGIPLATLTNGEMEALFSFLYFIRFLDEPGDVLKGEELVHRKRCVACHGIAPAEQKVGPNFRTLGAYANPIVWTQKMWNHAPTMNARMESLGLDWPTFEGDEMVDLIAYVQSIADSTERTYLEPGDHERGRVTFVERGCGKCHDDPNANAPQLANLAQHPKTVSQMAGLMWNHAPAMVELARSRGAEWSTIGAQDMADLITYFFSIRFYAQAGDPRAGEQVFFAKNCNICHSQSGIARNFRVDQERLSPIQMAEFMWNHGLEMLQKMEEMHVPWPTFSNNEMVDLLAYLNSDKPDGTEPADD